MTSHAPVARDGAVDLDRVAVRRALISVSDKAGLVDFARALARHGVEILSTGGSAKTLAQAGLAVGDVGTYTGFPEIMDGRVKTLHPRVHGGILARRDVSDHARAMAAHDIACIDLVVVNLYPFEATIAAGADVDTAIENIDIGGPALIRAAAKNHDFVAVITDPSDYAALIAELDARGGGTTRELRRRLAAKAFRRTAAYDAAIGAWFAGLAGDRLPERITIAGHLKERLRYGENPHQLAALYVGGEARPGVASARQVQGKELSYNNLNDTDAAFELAAEFDHPAVAIIKHANPCGVAIGKDLAAAWTKALACDPVSAFGGIVAVNRRLDAATAEAIGKLFLEVVIAPEADEAALALLAARKNLRVLVTGAMPDPLAPGLTAKTIAGGLLVSTRDNGRIEPAALKCVTRRRPEPGELADLAFAFTCAKHVRSNAIVYAKDGATVGIGAGQMSRVDSARIAAWKAEEAARAAGEKQSRCIGSVVASDAFFPFADGLIACAEAGARAVIQPGGSMRDDEVIKAADARDLAMVMTGMRHFRH